MNWPDFNNDGDLPIGIHRATLAELTRHFGTSSLRRQIVIRRLERIYEFARSTGRLARFVVFGSFVTAKPDPNDVDIFMLMEDTFDSNQVTGEAAIIFDISLPRTSKEPACFGFDGWPRLAEKTRTSNIWQIKRDNAKRGIVEVVTDA